MIMSHCITRYQVKLVRESNARYEVPNRIRSASDAAKICNTVFSLDDETVEVLVVLYLDTKNKVIGVHEVSRGVLDSSLVTPREVYKGAMLTNAKGILLAHNHPSGDCEPSNADKNVTEKLKKAGEILGIELIDHLVIGYDSYYSFRENGSIA